MYSIYLIKKTEQSDSTLRHSAVRFKRSFIRARPLAKKTASLIKEKKLSKVNFGFWNADFGFKIFWPFYID